MAGKRILFVDDDEMMLEAIPEMLESLGYEVIPQTGERCAASGITPKDRWVPDLILADSSAGSKIEHVLKERALRHEPGIPVVFMTVPWENFTPEIRTPWKVVYKPFTKAELVAALHGAWEGAA